MKELFKAAALLFVLYFIWNSVKQSKSREFQNNLPALKAESPVPKRPVPLDPGLARKVLPNIPLKEKGNFALNEAYKGRISELYTHIFDRLRLLDLTLEQTAGSTLPGLDAASIIQLHVYQVSMGGRDKERRELAILALGVSLNRQSEASGFTESYLMQEGRWLAQMQNLHFLLMQEPKDYFLNMVFLQLLKPATTKQTLVYFERVQFLYRGPTDEYYTVQKHIMERFEPAILRALLDKVDDYAWWAAYPDRDAEQALLELLK